MRTEGVSVFQAEKVLMCQWHDCQRDDGNQQVLTMNYMHVLHVLPDHCSCLGTCCHIFHRWKVHWGRMQENLKTHHRRLCFLKYVQTLYVGFPATVQSEPINHRDARLPKPKPLLRPVIRICRWQRKICLENSSINGVRKSSIWLHYYKHKNCIKIN